VLATVEPCSQPERWRSLNSPPPPGSSGWGDVSVTIGGRRHAARASAKGKIVPGTWLHAGKLRGGGAVGRVAFLVLNIARRRQAPPWRCAVRFASRHRVVDGPALPRSRSRSQRCPCLAQCTLTPRAERLPPTQLGTVHRSWQARSWLPALARRGIMAPGVNGHGQRSSATETNQRSG